MTPVEEHHAAVAEQDRKIIQCDERLAVNRETAAAKAHAAKVLKEPKAQAALDQLDGEHERVTRDRGHHVAARATAQSLLEQAQRDAGIEAQRAAALKAREAWSETEVAMQEFASAVAAVVVKHAAILDGLAIVNGCGFGPHQSTVSRWAQRFILAHLQARRDLRIRDADFIAPGECAKLLETPALWRANTEANILRVLGEASEVAA